MIYFTSENILLIGSVITFVAITLTRVGYKFGVPALLLFLIVGMLFGQDGIGLIYNNYRHTQFIGIVALSVILFTGGMETKFTEIKPVIKQGLVLSTLGIVLTTIFLGLFIYAITRIYHIAAPVSIVMCFLMAAVMSSTDSASVFNILKHCNLNLKDNLKPMLELESGSNDPMAYCLTILLIQIAQILYAPGTNNLDFFTISTQALFTLIMQMGGGAVMGLGLGYASVWVMRRIKLNSSPLYAIMLISISIFTFSITGMINGNGFLAVYIAGLIIGNKTIPNKKEILKFLDGMTWLMQIGMFLTLGLLITPNQMLKLAPMALLVGLFLIFIARPLSVFLCLLPFKMHKSSRILVSWVGLKGAVPIIFATYPIVAEIPGSESIFNIVFFITLLSLVLQGMTITKLASILNLAIPNTKKPDTFGIEIPEEAGKLIDILIKKEDLINGNTLKEISLPEGARVVMIYRNKRHIVPDGSVHLKEGDKLLMIFGEY